MTEEEAKTKWCHAAGGPNPRHTYEGRWNNRCIASACMAWRVATLHDYRDAKGTEPPEGDGWEPDGEGFEAGETAWRRSWTVGYCGLAGQP